MLQRIIMVMLALLATLALIPPAAAQQANPAIAATFEPSDCMFEFPILSFISPAWLGFECGYVTVPEQHTDPDGPTIRLAVATLPATVADDKEPPLFLAQGGPGGSSLEFFPLFIVASPLRNRRDIVIFDQRGTLYSEPNLLCQELDELQLDVIEQHLSAEEEDRLGLEAFQACRKRLEGEGINLAAYNSLENAADIEAVRQALGYDRISFYGVSYGTLLAQHYMRSYPDSLHAVVLDAVVPTQGSFLADVAQSADRAFKEIARLCAEDVNCSSNYPNLEDTMYQVMADLNRTPIQVTVIDPDSGHSYRTYVDGETFIGVLFQAMYISEILPALPALVHNVQAGETGALSSLLSFILFQRTFSAGMYQSVICSEEAGFRSSDMPVSGVRPELASLMQADNATLLSVCDLWGVPPLAEQVNSPLESNVPTLLLSGRFDPITPPAFAERTADTLSQGYSYTFPNTSHGAFISSICATSMIEDFLDKPQSAPRTACIATEPTTFNIPTPDTVVMTPAMNNVTDVLNGRAFFYAGLLFLGIFGLVSFFLVWPAAFLLRKIMGRPATTNQPPTLISWGVPLLVSLLAGLIVLFVMGVFALALVADSAEMIVGIPTMSAPLFLMPLLILLLTLLMVVSAVAIWLRGYWALWRRLYYSLLTLSAVAVLAVLVSWDMLTVFL